MHISDASEEHFARLLADGPYPLAEPVAMRAGDASFHNGWTVHKALPNASGTTREVMTVIWFADGLTVISPTTRPSRATSRPGCPVCAPVTPPPATPTPSSRPDARRRGPVVAPG